PVCFDANFTAINIAYGNHLLGRHVTSHVRAQTRGDVSMASRLRDLTFAFRRISKSPGIAVAAIVSIGLGIAANATIFSIVSTFVLRPAPVGEPGTLLALHTQARGESGPNHFTWPLYTDVREQA